MILYHFTAFLGFPQIMREGLTPCDVAIPQANGKWLGAITGRNRKGAGEELHP